MTGPGIRLLAVALALPALLAWTPLAAARTAKVAVIQAEGSPRQDAFLASYDFAKVRPQMQAHLDKLLGLLDQAGELGADIVCGPEDMQGIGAYGIFLDKTDPATGEVLFNSLAEPVPGPLTDRIAEIARKHGMYIVAPIYEKLEGQVYNSAVVFDREGKIIGKHFKTHLPVLETWLVTPGTEYPVFEADFGKFAVATCWEITYPEITRIMALEGAELIFHPTMGRENKEGQSLETAHRYLTRAVDNRVWLAPVMLGSEGNGIIDYNGKVVAEALGKKNTVIIAEVDFAGETMIDGSWWPTLNGTDNEKAMHYVCRKPELFRLLTDPHPPLMEKYRDVRITTGDRQRQLKAMEAVDYGP